MKKMKNIILFLLLHLTLWVNGQTCFEVLKNDFKAADATQDFKNFVGSDPDALYIYASLSTASKSVRTDINVLQFYKKLTNSNLDAFGSQLIQKLDDAKLKSFAADFKNADVADLNKLAANNGKLVKAWEGLINTPTLRKNTDWLTRSSMWIDEGGEFVTTNGVTKLRKGTDDILEIKNEKILPNKYSSTGTPIGDPSNGYQVVKNGNELAVKRLPDTNGYDSQDLAKLTGSNAHPNCHVLERHGHDVTDDALIKRATTRPSVAPDGSTINNPPDYSSKFDSPEKVVEGMNNTKQGTSAWNTGQQQGNRRIVEYESSSIVGKGVPRDGSNFVTTKKILAIYVDIGSGNYKILTMYPSF